LFIAPERVDPIRQLTLSAKGRRVRVTSMLSRDDTVHPIRFGADIAMILSIQLPWCPVPEGGSMVARDGWIC
jgi:hypothetical protein